MMPKILQAACLAATAAVLMMSAPAGNAVESTQPEAARRLPKDASWSLLLRNDDKVAYKGVLNSDPVGAGSGQILYPAPNAAGLLAAMITHGIIIESVKNSEKEKQLQAANQVLLPYQAILNDYRTMELMRRGLEKAAAGSGRKLLSSAEDGGGDWLFESAPIFSLTQDQRAIVLDNNIAIYAPGATTAAALQYTVRVVSQARDDEDPVHFWTADQGEKLKDESASLFAQSLDLALNEAMTGPKDNVGAYRTVRYREGGNEKMERAQIVSEHCNRLVIKTLRGWLMSVPARQNGSAAMAAKQCEALSDAPK